MGMKNTIELPPKHNGRVSLSVRVKFLALDAVSKASSYGGSSKV